MKKEIGESKITSFNNRINERNLLNNVRRFIDKNKKSKDKKLDERNSLLIDLYKNIKNTSNYDGRLYLQKDLFYKIDDEKFEIIGILDELINNSIKLNICEKNNLNLLYHYIDRKSDIFSFDKRMLKKIVSENIKDIPNSDKNLAELLKYYIKNDLSVNKTDYNISKYNYDFNFEGFVNRQKYISNEIRGDSKEGIIIRDKISSKDWWELQAISRNDDLNLINCCPNKKFCCYFNISYYTFFVISIIFSVIMHYIDLASDLYILSDLFYRSTEYFSICLLIFILSSFVNGLVSSFLMSSNNDLAEQGFEARCIKNMCENKSDMLKGILGTIPGILQINILIDAYNSISKRTKGHGFIFCKFMEGLFEGCPQSLFQLFIVLKNSESTNILDLGRYYFSISISIINLALASVFFEMYWYKNVCKLEDRGTHVEGVSELSFSSPYILNLLAFRFLELTSRITLLSCLSYATNSGISIIILFSLELILLTLLPIITFNDIKREIICDDFKGFRKCYRTFLHFLMLMFSNIPNLPLLWRPFSTRMVPGIDQKDLYHYPVKILTTIPMMVIILIKLITSTYSLSFLVLSLIGLISFPLSFINLYYIWKWNKSNNYFIIKKEELPNFFTNSSDKYINKFKELSCCCSKKVKEDKLDKIL
jgi:hypothetical protein